MKKYLIPLLTSLAMLVMILDTATAMSGAAEGLELCVRTIIPSLFPFFVLSALLTGSLSLFRFRALRPLGALCRLPTGSEPLLILGLLGGYPTGAQNIAQNYAAGGLTKKDARRMLGFCSNAGPAFLFGIVSAQFPDPGYVWVLWGIHIVSAVLAGILLSGKAQGEASITEGRPPALPDALQIGLRSTAWVCGWVILFRILIGFFTKWFGSFLRNEVHVIFCGILELSIGCCKLNTIENIGLRFVICAVLLGLGGMCVLAQTMSVTGSLGLGAYIPGKAIQAIISFQLAYQAQFLLLSEDMRLELPHWLIFGVWIFLFSAKITVAIRRYMMYNSDKSRDKRSCLCFFAKTSPKPATTAPTAPAMKRA